MGNRYYKRAKEKGGSGVAVFAQPSRRAAAPHNRGARTMPEQMKPLVALPLLPPSFCLPTHCPHSCCRKAGFSPFFLFSVPQPTRTSHFRYCLSISFSPVFTYFIPFLPSTYITYDLLNLLSILTRYCLWKEGSLCVLTAPVIEFWSFPIL